MALMLCTALCACGFIPGTLVPEDQVYKSLTEQEKDQHYVYKLYPGPARNPADLVIILMNDVPTASIDGLDISNTDYQIIHLLPGVHTLSWKKTFGISVMVDPAMEKSAEFTLSVPLEAGHTYRLYADRTYGTGYQIYFWIQDENSGTVIGGRKKP